MRIKHCEKKVREMELLIECKELEIQDLNEEIARLMQRLKESEERCNEQASRD